MERQWTSNSLLSVRWSYRARMGPGMSWNFILAFSRTGRSWLINADPGKSWKCITLVIEFSLKAIFGSIIFRFELYL